MKAILRKVTWNKGQTDNGTVFDYTRVFIERPISDSSVNEFGFDLIQCEYGDESKKVELQHLRGKLPVEVDIELMPEIKGKKVIQKVYSMKVVQASSTKS
jgi:hypothetical protein